MQWPPSSTTNTPPSALTFLSYFCPCDQIWACEDIFWLYSILGVRIWDLRDDVHTAFPFPYYLLMTDGQEDKLSVRGDFSHWSSVTNWKSDQKYISTKQEIWYMAWQWKYYHHSTRSESCGLGDSIKLVWSSLYWITIVRYYCNIFVTTNTPMTNHIYSHIHIMLYIISWRFWMFFFSTVGW